MFIKSTQRTPYSGLNEGAVQSVIRTRCNERLILFHLAVETIDMCFMHLTFVGVHRFSAVTSGIGRGSEWLEGGDEVSEEERGREELRTEVRTGAIQSHL